MPSLQTLASLLRSGPLLLLSLLILAASPAAAQRLYVDASAAGAADGTSWADAFTDLQDALAVAASGSEVWVAEGTYTPHPANRDASFVVTDGLRLYGGFPAGGAPFDARDPATFVTVLSGDLAGDDDGPRGRHENALHVVWVDGTTAPVTASTVLDGFTVTAGNANGPVFPKYAGGGLFCDGLEEGGQCSPTLVRLRFVANSASTIGGAAAFFGASGGASSPTLTDVDFVDNRAGAGGAVAFIAPWGGVSYAEFTRVKFADNLARHSNSSRGGAVYVNARGAESDIAFTDVSFSRNTAEYGEGPGFVEARGGAVWVDGSQSGSANLTFTRATFEENAAADGGALTAEASSTGGGGGTVKLTFTHADFIRNTALGPGGALRLRGREGSVEASFVNVSFVGNTTGDGPAHGGALNIDGAYGGSAHATFANTIFAGNTAGGGGGAVEVFGHSGQAAADFAHTTFYGNRAGYGGAVHAWGAGGGSAELGFDNSILWGNEADVEDDQVTLYAAAGVFERALIEGGCPSYADCNGLVTDDPLFVDSAGADGTVGTADDDLRLQPGSPALDVGDPALLPADTADLDDDGDVDEPLPLDLSGGARVLGPAPDLGAYEGGTPVAAETGTGPSGTAVLGPAAPNPFRSRTSFLLTVAEAQPVRVEAFDVLGRRVAVLLDGEVQPGEHRLTFDEAGLPAGLYLIRLSGPGGTASKRVTLLR